MKLFKSKRFWAAVGVGLLLPIDGVAQLFGPTFTIDVAAEARLGKQLLYWAKQVGYAEQTAQMTRNQVDMLRQQAMFLTNKQAFQTSLQMLANRAMYSPVGNIYGETAGMNQALTLGGRYSLPAWAASAVQLDNRIATGQIPTNPAALSSLASVEIMSAAGTNNIATVGSSRQFLTQTQTARTALQNAIASPDEQNNREAAQLNLLASASGQSLDLGVQNLQVNTSTLQTVGGIAKEISDVHAHALNSQVAIATYQQTEETTQGGFAEAFSSHP